MSSVSTINFVNDLGYGSVKGILDGHDIHIPSVAADENAGQSSDPARFHTKADERNYMNSLLDNLDIMAKSQTVHGSKRYLLGKNAITSGLPLRTFDVSSYSGKSTDDFSYILTLGIIAGYALQKYYRTHHKIPFSSGINVHVNMATALPILEGLKGGNFQQTRIYKKHYVLYDHTVNIYNFGHPVAVHIHFNNTKTIVMLEGESAHYAVKYAKKLCPGLVKCMRSYFIHHYPQLAKGAQIGEIDDVLTLQNSKATTIGIDIGEGTTDFDVFSHTNDRGNKINKNDSSSIQDGYGDVLNKALSELKSNGHNIHSRMQLKRIINSTDPLDRVYKKPVMKTIHKYEPMLEHRIIDELSQVLRDTSSARVIYVYGGGSIPMEHLLRRDLEEKTDEYTNGIGIIVIFINPKYAQIMNRLGLALILNIFK